MRNAKDGPDLVSPQSGHVYSSSDEEDVLLKRPSIQEQKNKNQRSVKEEKVKGIEQRRIRKYHGHD